NRLSTVSGPAIRDVDFLTEGDHTELIAVTDNAAEERLLLFNANDATQPLALGVFRDGTKHYQKRLLALSGITLDLRGTPSPTCPGVNGLKFTGDLAVATSSFFDLNQPLPIVHSLITFYDISQRTAPCFLGRKLLTTHPGEALPVIKGTVRGVGQPRRVVALKHS